MDLWEDRYHVTVSACALLLALTLFTKQIRGSVWAAERKLGPVFGYGEYDGVTLGKHVKVV